MTKNTLSKSSATNPSPTNPNTSSKTLAKTKKPTSNLVVPMDLELKKVVQAILAELGLNQSQLVVSMFKEVARTRKVPLSFDLNDDKWANAREATAIEAAAIEESLASGIASPAEVKELADLLGIKLQY